MRFNLIFLVNHMDNGGCQKIVFDLAESATCKNIFLVSRPGHFIKKISNKNIKFINRGSLLGFLRFVFLLVKLRLTTQRILLHTHNRRDILYKFFLGKKDKHLHTYHSAYHSKNFLMKYVRANKAISISKVVQNYLKKYNIKSTLIYNGIDLKKTSSIYNGNDLKNTSSTEKNKISIINLLYVGRLSSEKGIFELIQALKKININYHLYVKGIGNMLDLCKSISNDNVTFLGFDSNPWVDAKSYDIVIIPSFYEGFCLVALEAISNNLPVLCNDLPIFREILPFLPTECFFNINDKESINSSISYFINNKYYVEKIIKSNKDKILTKFSKDEMIKQYNQIYNQ